MAVATRGELGVGRALTIDQLHERLEFVRNVMRREMKEGQDYGKIPGTGDKPSLLQPGAQKLLMTFNLREQVKKEALREFPQLNGIFGHREYEFTITVFPQGARPEDGWDGVGTCSTLESKYRYRKAERRCPVCKKTTIIAENEKFVPAGQVPGFLCWKKKGGCGAKFHAQHPDIINQPADDVENEDPADCWNTVRKMAFKRGLVAAAINATNTSELWTQDLEDMAGNAAAKGKGPQTSQGAPAATSRPPASQSPQAKPAAQQAPPANKIPPPKQSQFATDKSRAWLVKKLEHRRHTATEYFRKLEKPAVLLPNENLEDLPFEFLPMNKEEFQQLEHKITAFESGSPAEHAFPAHEVAPEEKKKRAAKKATAKPPAPKPQPAPAASKQRDPEWFFDVICPIPRKGMKRDIYLKNPDTVGTLYQAMKEGDQEAQKRLWGFARHWQPEPRTVGNTTYPVSAADTLFREALDAFVEWEKLHGQDNQQELPGTESAQNEQDEVQAQADAQADLAASQQEQDDEIPM